MNRERFLASSSASIEIRNAGPGIRTSALEKAGACPQLTIPPTAPSRPTEATSAVRPPESSTVIEIIVAPTGNRLARTWSPRARTISPGARSTISPCGSISARASDEKVDSSRLPAKASSARMSSSVVTCATFHFLRPALLVSYARRSGLRADNAPERKLLPSHADGFDHSAAAHEKRIGNQSERRNVDQAATFVD